MVYRDQAEGVLLSSIAGAARRLSGGLGDYEPLLDLVGDARIVLLGEATHGTQEFYQARAEITKRLIVERGFSAVAVEGDWPDAYRVNRFVQGQGRDVDADRALSGFRRFPQWMWRNTAVVELVSWLRAHNDALPPGGPRAGFYGLDLYSLHGSIEAVIEYLEANDPEAAQLARERYACFEDFGQEPQAYGYVAGFGLGPTCESEAIAQLMEMQRRRAELVRFDGMLAEDEIFYAEQNARVVKNAEEYYRSMFRGRVSTWNLRDTHMADTLDALVAHLDRRTRAKVVVWAHNSHVGDARATQMGSADELNLGQLVRERRQREAVLVGFTTFAGTVSAASEWGAPVERKRVLPALAGSYERLFHEVGSPRFFLNLRDGGEAVAGLSAPRLTRAIGVIYKPETERASHYLMAVLPGQFDAVLHFDETSAVAPLERTGSWDAGELPETYPSAL